VVRSKDRLEASSRAPNSLGAGQAPLRRPASGYTIIEMAQQPDIDPQWIYRGIAKGRIEIVKDLRYG
jgi:hypothetical protein